MAADRYVLTIIDGNKVLTSSVPEWYLCLEGPYGWHTFHHTFYENGNGQPSMDFMVLPAWLDFMW